jgi:Raf kinase inhibitor-like YbhB/YbcL family protein
MVTIGCDGDPGSEVDTDAAATLTVSSQAFAAGDDIPQRFTCDGEGVSPPLAWSDRPADAWALVVDDPDAPGGTYVHWFVIDIASGTTSVETGDVPVGGMQMVNSSGDAAYAGPCPPSGEHQYRFTIYALDAPTALTQSASLDQALEEISSHATASGTLTATYSRP